LNVNKVFLGGHLTQMPELRYTPKGTAHARVPVAVNRNWKTESGEEKEEVTFVDCIAWGRTAEVIVENLRKGSPLFIEGRLRLEQWEKDGEKRQKLSVVVESFQFVGKKGDAKSPDPATGTDGDNSGEDDVPF
jgi:single-strand DNA-binding protein